MALIKILDSQTAQSIAAGEVVERPASVVKELCENALDAGADRISISIEQGGIKLVRVSDNGSGMSTEDALLAFKDHATSKITGITDLDTIQTLGFRGEALPTIAAVSRVMLETGRPEDPKGTRLCLDAGTLVSQDNIPLNPGTKIEVRDLFYNTPARYKFLKQDRTEASRVTEVVRDLALSRPDVSFYLESQGKEILHTPGDNRLLSAIYAVLGQDMAKGMVPLIEANKTSMVHCTGYISLPSESKKSRTWQLFYVNGRPIQSPVLTRALEDAYKSTLMQGRFPACVLMLTLPGNLVDVNVHPRKLEVRFWNDGEIYKQVYGQVQNALFTALHHENPEPAAVEEPDRTLPQSTDSPEFLSSTESSTMPQNGPDTVASRPSTSYLDFNLDGYTKLSQTKLNEPLKPYEKASDTSHKEDLPTQSAIAPAEQMSFLPPEDETLDMRLRVLKEGRYAGELFRTYLIFEYRDHFILLDQHAAHEKILFERAVSSYTENQVMTSQSLLQAQPMQLAAQDIFILEDNEDFIKAYGFDYSFIGPKDILIRKIPIGHEVLDPALALRFLLDEIHEKGVEGVKGETDLIYHMLATSSCKAAVKAHDALHPSEVDILRKDLLTLDNPFHCPHGRPIFYIGQTRDLEKLFKRIV
jgi:DNA mismatch repair protein MutL